MFKFAQPRAVDRAVWDDDDAEQVQVQYNDGGLQQQLAAHLQSTKTTLARAAATVVQAPAVAQRTWRRPATPPSQLPAAAEVQALIGDLQHLTQAFQQEAHSPHKRKLSYNVDVEAFNEHHVQQQNQVPDSTAAVLNNNRQLLAGLLQECQQQPQQDLLQQPSQQQAVTKAVAALPNPWSQQHPEQQEQQLLTHASQHQQHQAQQQQRVPGSFGQILAPQSQTLPQGPAKPQQHKGQQQRRKSVLYGTPQQQVPKKKPRFSIKDTPVTAGAVNQTPGVAGRPGTVAKAAPAAAAGASTQGMPNSQAGGMTGPAALAALLGGNAATPARQRPPAAGAAGIGRMGESSGAAAATGSAADFSKTPGSSSRKAGVGASGLFVTPKFSTNKGSRLGNVIQRSPALGFSVTTAAAAAAAVEPSNTGAAGRMQGVAAADVVEEDADLAPVPAALFREEEAATAADEEQPDDLAAAAAAAVTPRLSRDKGSHGRRSSITTNPLQVMEEQRQRQALFLSALPAAAVTRSSAFSSNSGMMSCLVQSGGRGVHVPVGSSLAKVMQQIVAAQKEQQELLQQRTAEGGARQPAAAGGRLELEVVSKHWEAHMVKCLCTVTGCQQQQQEMIPQQPTQLQQQQNTLSLGEQVFLFIASKTALNVELSPGHRVCIHAPWYEAAQQAPGQLATVLAYLISSVV